MSFLDPDEVAGLCRAAGFGPPTPPTPPCAPCPPCPPPADCPTVPPPPAEQVLPVLYPPAQHFYRQFAAGVLSVAVLGYLFAYVQWGIGAWCRARSQKRE